jgi:hypothetical protein
MALRLASALCCFGRCSYTLSAARLWMCVLSAWRSCAKHSWAFLGTIRLQRWWLRFVSVAAVVIAIGYTTLDLRAELLVAQAFRQAPIRGPFVTYNTLVADGQSFRWDRYLRTAGEVFRTNWNRIVEEHHR